MKKIHFSLTEKQATFLHDNPDFDVDGWFFHALDNEINKRICKNENINVVIAAAGYDERASMINNEIPKAMLKIKGKSILERQIDIFRGFGIDDITVVRGYKKEEINLTGVKYIDNDRFSETGIFYSFSLAAEKITGKTILCYADILFEKEIVDRLLNSTSDIAIIVDKSWRDHYHDRLQHTMGEAELVEQKDGLISRIGTGLPVESAYGEFIGLAAFSIMGAKAAKNLFKELKETSVSSAHQALNKPTASLSDFFNALIMSGVKICPVDILGGWFEIDTFEDFRKSWVMVP